MPIIRVLVMLATMVMELAKTAKGKKVLNNAGDYLKTRPNSRLHSIIGVATITAVLMTNPKKKWLKLKRKLITLGTERTRAG